MFGWFLLLLPLCKLILLSLRYSYIFAIDNDTVKKITVNRHKNANELFALGITKKKDGQVNDTDMPQPNDCKANRVEQSCETKENGPKSQFLIFSSFVPSLSLAHLYPVVIVCS